MRLIDADVLKETYFYPTNTKNAPVLSFISLEEINNVPTIEAEPVIRCKDCEYYTEEERWCRRLGLCGAFDQNDYCSHAERRTDA